MKSTQVFVHEAPTHCLNHTLDLVLTYGIESEQLTVFHPVLSDHFYITFEFTLLDYTASEKNFTYRRCLSENAVTSFKELISSLVPSSFLVQAQAGR